LLRFFKEPIIPNSEIKALLTNKEEDIRVEAFLYLLRYTKEDKQNLMEKYLNLSDHYISSTALLALVENSRSSFTLRYKDFILKKLEQLIEVIETTSDYDLKQFLEIITIKIRALLQQDEDIEILEKYLSHENSVIVSQAITSTAFTLNECYIGSYIDLLGSKLHRNEAKHALFQYGFSVIEELGKRVRQKEVPLNSLHFIPSVLEQFESQKAVAELFLLLDHEDLAVRLESIRSLNKIQAHFPLLNIRKRDVIEKINRECKIYLQTLNMIHTQVLVGFHNKDKNSQPSIELVEARQSLMKLLESRMESHLERIFGLLGLTYPSADVSKAYEAIQSEQTDMRINAIEYLDNLLEGDLKRLLIPIVEISILDSISEEILRDLDLKVMGEFECFKLILKRNDNKLKLAVIYLIGFLKDPRYLPLLKELEQDSNAKVRDYAHNALGVMGS
jgi:AAA family ATP:ADP antiporter